MELTEKYQVMPSMPPEQFEALKADIAERGVLVPIDVDEDGHILDGHHRYRACTELGITDFPTIVRPGLSEEERRIFARKANMLRRHLNRKQVRHLIADQLKDTPDWANNRIAQILGTDAKTVKTVRERLEATSEIPKLDKLIGADGKARPVKQKRPPAVTASNADELSRILEKISQGASIEDLQGFLSEQNLTTIHDPNYDRFAHCDDDDTRAWLLWLLWQINSGADPEGAEGHMEWILNKQFKNPAEWFGDEGMRFRAQWSKRPKFPGKILRAWDAFLEEHRDMSLVEVDAALRDGATRKGKAA